MTVSDLEAVARQRDVVRLRIVGLTQSLEPLEGLVSLRELDLVDPRTLDGLDRLQQLEALILYAIPHVGSLAPIAKLTSLKKLLVSTPPGYDASRKCYEVESFEPIASLTRLEELTMRGIVPRSGRLRPLERLTSLRTIGITHVYVFGIADYAQLAHALPDAEGHCLQPVFEATWAGTCSRCGGARVAFTAPPPRSPRTACPVCDRVRIQRHVNVWNSAVKR
jgi:hypothetical protein